MSVKPLTFFQLFQPCPTTNFSIKTQTSQTLERCSVFEIQIPQLGKTPNPKIKLQKS